MDARDEFIDVLRSRGMMRPGEEWVIDANLKNYTHELAEQLRAKAKDAHVWHDNGFGCGACDLEEAADEMDPPVCTDPTPTGGQLQRP